MFVDICSVGMGSFLRIGNIRLRVEDGKIDLMVAWVQVVFTNTLLNVLFRKLRAVSIDAWDALT